MKSSLALLLSLLVVGCVEGSEDRGSAEFVWGASVNGLSCRVEADRSTYRVGESIVLRWYVRNQSGNALAFSISPGWHSSLHAYDHAGVPLTERVMMDNLQAPPDPIPWPGISAGDVYESSYSLAIQEVELPASTFFGGADPYEGYALEFGRVAGRSLYPVNVPGTYSLSVRLLVDVTERERAAEAGVEHPWIGELESSRIQIEILQ